MIFGNRKNIFEVLKEAEEDEKANTSNQTSDTDNNSEGTNDNTETNQPESAGESEDEYADDEDFSIDTSLDDDPNDEDSGDDFGSDDSGNGSDTGSSSNDTPSEEEGSDEPIKANTDIFSSLSNEEQQIKIKELKNLFNQMYCSCDDLISRINDIDPDETNMVFVERVSSTMYELKRYIGDYIVNVFSTRSYIENDVAFNRFLSIFKTIGSILSDLGDIKGVKNGTKDDKK